MSEPHVAISVREHDPCASTKGRRARLLEGQLAQVAVMHEAVRPRIAKHSRTAYWCQMWEFEVLKAAGNERFNRKQFKWLRFTALVSALLVTTLAGISISVSGPWSMLIRVTTLVLGLISAVSTGATAVFRPGERWLLYRRLQSDLMAAAWRFINKDGDDESWDIFLDETDTAMRTYDQQYQSTVIAKDLPKDEGTDQHKLRASASD